MACPKCGYIPHDDKKGYVKKRWYRNNDRLNVFLSILSFATVLLFVCFAGGTLMDWIVSSGQAWSDPFDSTPNRKLVECVWLNLQMIWHILRYNIV